MALPPGSRYQGAIAGGTEVVVQGGGVLTSNEVVVDREQGQLETVEHAGLVEDVGKMVLYGLLADRKLPGDLAVAVSGHDRRDDLQLPRGEAEILGAPLLYGGAREGLEAFLEVGERLAAHPVLAGGHRADPGEEGGRRRFLRDVAARSQPERFENVVSFDRIHH